MSGIESLTAMRLTDDNGEEAVEWIRGVGGEARKRKAEYTSLAVHLHGGIGGSAYSGDWVIRHDRDLFEIIYDNDVFHKEFAVDFTENFPVGVVSVRHRNKESPALEVINVIVTKYATTKGLYRTRVVKDRGGTVRICGTPCGSELGNIFYCDEYETTDDAAIAKFKELQKKKIKSLNKSLKRVSALLPVIN